MELSKQRVIEILKEQELNTNYARLEGEEKERKRIAEDLHDRLGSMLSTIKLYFNSLQTPTASEKGERQAQFEKANALLDQATDEVRNIAHNMVSSVLAKFGLKSQLQTLEQTLVDSKQLNVEIKTHGLKDRLDNFMEIQVYRIIQELVNNTIKHAKASNLSSQLNRFKEVLNIVVEDNGVGFDPKLIQLQEQGGMGMKNIQTRIHGLDGSLQIDSGTGHGTTKSIDLPLV